ncbi:hypothetical protein ACFLU6_08720 [Acidobacteriota bacterium]
MEDWIRKDKPRMTYDTPTNRKLEKLAQDLRVGARVVRNKATDVVPARFYDFIVCAIESL